MRILLVEENKGDQMIMQEAFQQANVSFDLDIVNDGIEAIDFLNREGEFQKALRPDLIILDLNLPRKSGREVLAYVKSDPRFQHLPVIVFSNSSSQKDICECYSLKVNAYVVKPARFQGFVDFAHMIRIFWGELVHYCSHS